MMSRHNTRDTGDKRTHSALGGVNIDQPPPLLISSGHTSIRNHTIWPTIQPTMSAPRERILPAKRPDMRIMAIGSWLGQNDILVSFRQRDVWMNVHKVLGAE
jgi:hypothetical protein